MDMKQELIRGLQSSPKYIPQWFIYDKHGSIYYDRCLAENTFYYVHRSEISGISENVSEMINLVEEPCILVDLGSGNSFKARMFIDALIQKQKTLTYIPIDISEQHLLDTSKTLSNEYGDIVKVQPIVGDFSVGVEQLRKVQGNKLIVCFGSIQGLPDELQVRLLKHVSSIMTENDRLLVSLDVTQNKKEIEEAYNTNDPTGVNELWYVNGVLRLNRQHGSEIDITKFEVETQVTMSTASDVPSYVTAGLRAKCDQIYEIPGLGINLNFKTGEYIAVHDGEAVSCKYTMEQIRTLVKKGNLILEKSWISKDKHASFSCLMKGPQ